MEINLFTLSDYKEICEWHEGWNMSPPPLEFLSCLGVIIPGIAAGFLSTTNINVGVIDSFISNPKAGKKDRYIALDLIMDKLMYLAKGVGCKAVRFHTRYDTLMFRAKKRGFKEVEKHTMLVKEI